MSTGAWQIASRLLSIETRRSSLASTGPRHYPAFVVIANLFFCAYMEQYLKTDPGGHYLSLFLVIEFSVMGFISVGAIMGRLGEMILKTSIFPIPASSYLIFLVASLMRRPVILALLLSTLFFLMIPFHSSVVMASLCVFLAGSAFLDIELIIVVICLVLTRSSQPLAGFAILGLYAVVAVVLGAMVFHLDTLLDALPIISWSVKGIIAAQHGLIIPGALAGLAQLLIFVVFTLIGRRISLVVA